MTPTALATMVGALEAVGTALLASQSYPDRVDGSGSPLSPGHTPEALLRGLLAVVYRLGALAEAGLPVAAGTPWDALAERLGPDSALGALGLDPTRPPVAEPDPDAVAVALVGRRVPQADVDRLLDASAAGATGSDGPRRLAALHEALLTRHASVSQDRLVLAGAGGARRAGGSFYTPPSIVEWLLDAALSPALDASDSADGLHVCDPACGAGAFLIAAVRRVRARLGTTPDAARRALATAYGVDLDPLAVLLCRLALWNDALASGAAPDPALAATVVRQVRRGNALLGADPEAVAAGIPDAAWDAWPRDAARRALVQRNRRERDAEPGVPGPIDAAAAQDLADAWCASFCWPPGAPDALTTGHLRARARARGTSFSAATGATIGRLAVVHGFHHWTLAFPEVADAGGFDVVLGNPPFLNQLERGTVTSRAAASLLRARFGTLLRAYTDTAALLLLQGTRLLRLGGRIGMIAPQSLLAARDARGVREALLARATPTHLWWAGAHMFPGASVYVTALALRRHDADAAPRPDVGIARAHGPSFAPLPALPPPAPDAETWAPLVADALGAPTIVLPPAPTLGSLARATADFRDEYYGLLPFVVDRADADEDAFPRLVLTGHVDPAHAAWGERPVRFGKRAWKAPRVDRAALEAEGSLAAWARGRRVPKLLVAGQTRVLEAVADPGGRWLTTTPTISVFPEEGALWHVAAVLLGPVASAWALGRYGATALAAGAIKLSAGQLLGLPLPTDRPAWDDAARHIAAAHAAADAPGRRAALRAAAAASLHAYCQDAALLAWWEARLPGA